MSITFKHNASFFLLFKRVHRIFSKADTTSPLKRQTDALHQKSRPYVFAIALFALIWGTLSFSAAWFYTQKQTDKAIQEAADFGKQTMDEVRLTIDRSVKTAQSVLHLVIQGSTVRPLLLNPRMTEIGGDQPFDLRRRHLEEVSSLPNVRSALFSLTNMLDEVEEMWLLNKHGIVVASSNSWVDANLADGLEGSDFSGRRYFKEAMTGTLSRHFVFIPGALHPSFFVAMPVYDDKDQEVLGVIAMSVVLPHMTPQWVGESIVMLVDHQGLVTYSSDYRYESMMLPEGTASHPGVERLDIRPWSEKCLSISLPLAWLEKLVCRENAANGMGKALFRFPERKEPHVLSTTKIEGGELMIQLFLPILEEEGNKIAQTLRRGLATFLLGALLLTLFVSFVRQARSANLAKEQEKQRKMAEELASYDLLTGLYSHMLADQLIEHSIAASDRHQHLMAVLFFDLVQFSDVNESYGYEVGDALLKEVASRLKLAVRKSDVVIRQAGDKFILLLNDLKEIVDSANIARTVLDHAKKSYELGEHHIDIPACIGIALYPVDGNTPSLLLRHAEAALHNTKATKAKDDYSFYQAQMSQDFASRKSMEADMKLGLARGEFRLFFQPQYTIESKSVHGCEALIRWQHPERGMVSPADFIPIAERSGFIVDLGAWIIQEACRQAARWHKELTPIQVAVNLSAVQFQRSDLVNTVKKALEDSGLPPELLELEITESMMMSDSSRTVAILKELKTMKIRVAIDDFGTGYSSLAYLKKFNADVLKVDQGFVREMHSNDDDRIIVGAVIGMANALDYNVVAEGVENQAQFDLLQSIGCHLIQGYFFSRPLPDNEFYHFVQKFLELKKEKNERVP